MALSTWHPGTLLQTSGSYWQGFALHTGVKLDLFSIIDGETLTADQISQTLGADLRGITQLLNALTAMGLLQKQENRFCNTKAALQFLCKSSSAYMGYMILHHHYLAESWAHLDEAVLSGQPLRSRTSVSNDQRREAFLMGMFTLASLQAPEIVKQIDLNDRYHLLDLGGGPGTYAIHFCQHNSELLATVFDLPTTKPFAEKTIARFNLSHRINFKEGDFNQDDLGGPYDVIWMSHILHAEGAQTCERLLAKAVAALSPGGMILIHDFILDNNMAGPLFATLFALNMLLGTPEGQSYSEKQIWEMLQKTGVSSIRRLDYCGPTESGIISAIADRD